MKPISPSIMEFGAFRVISPNGSHRIPMSLQAELATHLLIEPEPALLAEWVAAIEAKLKVTDAHRQALADRAVALVESGEDKRRRLLTEHRRAAALGAPMRDPDLVNPMEIKAAQAISLRAEAAALKIQSPKKSRQEIKTLNARAAKLEAEVEELRQTEIEQDRLYGDAKEPILRAKARGEDIFARDVDTAEVAKDEFGARIIERTGEFAGLPALIYGRGTKATKLSGIDHAFNAGYLDARGAAAQAERLYETGKSYREAYEIAEGHTSSGGEGGSGFGPKAPQPRLVEAGERLAAMRSLLNSKQLYVLDQVCGEDRRLRDIAPTRGSVPALQCRLRLALRVAAEGWARELQRREDSGDEPKSKQLRKITLAISRLRL